MPRPVLAVIAAMDRHHLIGDHGHLPWHLPEDLRLFRTLTEGNTVIMGRNTFESLGRKPLAGRRNIVISSTLPASEDVKVCRSFAQALAEAWRLGGPVFVIGGRQVYQKALAIADQLHISWVEGDFSGDVYFPKIDFGNWQGMEERDFNGFRYVRYRRKAEG